MSEEPLPRGLTGRELDVLTLLGGGLNNKDIAARLKTSVRTVSTHVEHLLTKLSQRSRAGAGAVAVDQGLVRLPIPGGGHGLEGLTVGLLDQAIAEDRGAASPILAEPLRPRGAARRPFLIGSALPLTGPAKGDGLEMRNGAALAIAEINARGGVAGRRLELVVVPVDVPVVVARVVVPVFAGVVAPGRGFVPTRTTLGSETYEEYHVASYRRRSRLS